MKIELMFLLDTNCFIQIIRARPWADEVKTMLASIPREKFFISDFTLHSIGVISARFGQLNGYISFVNDLGIGTDIAVIPIEFTHLDRIVKSASNYKLDFDDAYQNTVAEINDLKIVSFDSDFDRTPAGRLTPAAALQLFKDEQKPQQEA